VYTKKTNKSANNNLFIFTFLQEVLGMATVVSDTQFNSERRENSQAFQDDPFVLQIVQLDATLPV
jgi:hypothetical protein